MSQIRIGVAGVVLILAVVTAIVPDWLEEVFGFEPDGGDGSFEWAIVVVVVAAALFAAYTVRTEWRRLHSASDSSR